MYKSFDELRKDIAQYSTELQSKFNGKDGKRYVMLCGGTGCVAGGTMRLKGPHRACWPKKRRGGRLPMRVLLPVSWI